MSEHHLDTATEAQTETGDEPVTRDDTVIRRHVDLDVSIDDLWALVSDADGLAGWLGDSVDVDLRPGGTGAIVDDGVFRFVHVHQVEAGRSVSFSWWEPDAPEHTTNVRFEIGIGPAGGSRLEITETMDAASAQASAQLSPEARRQRWEARVCALWACTVVAALVA